jgi:UDP-glucose 4-epimerase
MNIGIIGSEGFIGKSIVHYYQNNPDISIFRFGTKERKGINNYQKIDLLNSNLIQKQFKHIHTIIYLASSSIPASSYDNPLGEVKENLIGFINFIEQVAQLKSVKHIIFASSAGTIYGNSSKLIKEESVKKPKSPHGITKLSMEYFLNYYSERFDFKYTILRISNVYGPGQDTSKGLGVINTFLENCIKNKPLKIYGNGEVVRNFIFIYDLINIFDFFIKNNPSESNIYNCGSDDNISINDLLTFLNNLNIEHKVEYIKNRKSDLNKILIDNKKLKSKITYMKFTPINDAIMLTFDHIKKQHEF